MIKKWLLSNIIGIIITVTILTTVSGLIFSLISKEEIVTHPNNVQFRSGPGRQYKSLATLKSGTRLIVVKKAHGWWQVRRSDNEKIGWVASWVANSTTLKVATAISEATIVLDPGHGGSDTGALSSNNKYMEKTYTLRTAKHVRAALKPTGARIIMTRDSDHIVPLLKIPIPGEKNKADAQISFHFDSSAEGTKATGISQYYYHKNSKSLAETISSSLNNMPLNNRGVDTAPYIAIKNTTQPAILLENGFINNNADLKYIRKASYQKKIAENLVVALKKYFNQNTEMK
ncbi:putative cell wall amidase lytH [Leuconostoc litchii]|uniref:N-acetylmuramoyl-L-alanine amidase n=1 Tax=Leuconostoc litchii TaxID=1981069 RepID=A0A6P2CMJ6_9LACO|nr:N-acetylmuramoyl-L-alanine amidase [Leuconostoc litchii]TYC46804.1 N-acetylmuramoyl-L-alanine amidase [Leuconostoc litchii]GMA70694.1 putative cell wall amidase lytH [Leuconostoc litchii]